VGWLVLQITNGNAFFTGAVVGIRTLPILSIGPWAGVLADRVDRRMLVMFAQIYMAVAAVGFAFLVLATDLVAEPVIGPLKWWYALIYLGVSGIAHSIVQPVRQTMVLNTVPMRGLRAALNPERHGPPQHAHRWAVRGRVALLIASMRDGLAHVLKERTV